MRGAARFAGKALAPESAVLDSVFNVLLGVCLVIALLPVISFVMQRVAAYNEGANCNAAGRRSFCFEVAARIAKGRVSEEEIEAARIHGADEAIASGLVPDGADIVYETAPVPDVDFIDESPRRAFSQRRPPLPRCRGNR